MPDIGKIEVKYTIKLTGVKNLAELKSRLNRIQSLTSELEKELDSISGTTVTFKEV